MPASLPLPCEQQTSRSETFNLAPGISFLKPQRVSHYHYMGNRGNTVNEKGEADTIKSVIDTHSHLLPGLDDGAATLEESLAMAREAAGQGVTEILCTPHLVDPDLAALDLAALAIAKVRDALETSGIRLMLHLGFEIDFYTALSSTPGDLAPFAAGAKRKVLIIEMPYDGWLPRAEEALFRLRLAGFVIVLAHPERSERLQRRPEVLADLLRQGMVAQGTVPSLLGDFGLASRKALLRLVAEGHLSLLATDAHHSRPTAWSFAPAQRELARCAPGYDPEWVVQLNPRSLIEGHALVPVAPTKVRMGVRGLFGHLGGNNKV
jgi:protein-tyrosine phosphatase